MTRASTPFSFLLAWAALLWLGAASAQDLTARPELDGVFAEAGTAGTMVVHLYSSDTTVAVGRERAAQPYAPSSTFKIPNTLIALRLGVVSGMEETFAQPREPYLVKNRPFLPDACSEAITLASALRNSCIPVFQEIAGRIGVARYNEFLQRMNYAPAAVTDANLRDFWLNGTIKLSALDQVAFLDRMIAGRLPIQTSHIDAVADAIKAGESEKGTLFAKTGYVFTAEPEVGWYVGWIRKDGQVTATFALNMDLLTPGHAQARREVALRVLSRLGLW